MGINAAYANEMFYMEHMAEDERRVQQLFMEAKQAGIVLQNRSLHIEELQELMLSGHYLLVILVDKGRLEPWYSRMDLCYSALSCGAGGGGYTGHYLLLVGFDGTRQEFVVQDPAQPLPGLRLPSSVLDEARKSFGTDEDLLLVEVSESVIGQPGGPYPCLLMSCKQEACLCGFS